MNERGNRYVHTRPWPTRPSNPEEGPRASFSQLLPFLFEHKGVLIVVAILSVFGAATTLAQPLLVGQVIELVQTNQALGSLVWAIVALVGRLLDHLGLPALLAAAHRYRGRLFEPAQAHRAPPAPPISEFDARRTGDLVSRVGTDTTLLYAVLTQGLADSVATPSCSSERSSRWPSSIRCCSC